MDPNQFNFGGTESTSAALNKQGVSQLGYNLGLPGMGISEPFGTPYDVNRTPAYVYSQPNNYGITGSVLGTTTDNGFIGPVQGPTQTPVNNTPQQQAPANNGFDMKYYPGWDPAAALADWNATGGSKAQNFDQGGTSQQDITNQINSMYDQYTQTLAGQGTWLDQQRAAQEATAGNQYGAGVSAQDLALQQGQQALGQQKTDLTNNQNKNLRSLSDNMRNMFMAGNVYLGARGAGDSSAANQYAYALNKVGTQARGDQMSQTADLMSKVNAQETNLKNTYDANLKQLQSERDSQINNITTWWAGQQKAIADAVAQGQLAKGQATTQLAQQALQTAQNALQQVQTNSQNQYNALISWATSNSKTIGELKTNLQQAGQFAMQLPGQSKVSGQPTSDAQGNVNMQPSLFGSADATKKNSIFG